MKKTLVSIAMLILTLSLNGIAHAQDLVLDDVETAVDAEWAQIRVNFTMPVNYLRHFPQEHGQQLQIFFTIIGLDRQNISLREEVRNVSATPVMPATTITFEPPLSLNLLRDPSSLTVRFNRSVSYNVRPGEDHRSIVIYMPIVPTEEIGPAEAGKTKSGTKN